MVKLGQLYKDSITGFEGTAVSITDYLYGCRRAGLEGASKPGEIFYFDEQRLTSSSLARTGGLMPTPPARDPK